MAKDFPEGEEATDQIAPPSEDNLFAILPVFKSHSMRVFVPLLLNNLKWSEVYGLSEVIASV